MYKPNLTRFVMNAEERNYLSTDVFMFVTISLIVCSPVAYVREIGGRERGRSSPNLHRQSGEYIPSGEF